LSSSAHPRTTVAHNRLDSWKEVAAYLGRSERTVRRWEEKEGLPVHRLQHKQRGSVYAYRAEIDAWLESRKQVEAGEALRQTVADPAGPPSQPRRVWAALAVISAIAVAILAAGVSVPRRPAGSSIAVLPFENLSGNTEEEWFTDGMTETLITELAKVRGLKVISRTSAMQYKNAKKSLKQIGTELGVSTVVEGSALRVGDRVRITAQLIETSTDTHLWSIDFDRAIKDVLSIHRDVAQTIAREVGLTVAPRRSGETSRSANPEAIASYLKGLYQFNRGALREAIEFAREGILADPQMARCHQLLGMALILRADFHRTTYAAIMPEARPALQRALELDPELGVSLSWLGWSYFALEHDWVQAETKLRRGFELDAGTGNNYAFLLAAQGRYEEAIRAVDSAILQDPANPFLLADRANIYLLARRYEEAIRFFRKAVDLSPTSFYPRLYLFQSLLVSGDAERAFEAFLSLPAVRNLELEREYRRLYGAGGWPAVWPLFIERLPNGLGARINIWGLISLDRKREALDELEKLEEKTDSWMLTLGNPIYDPLRREPRFTALLKRVGYPESMW
jgi:TolB-like protein/Flp pilus assembly protein TadD/predicted DNA-binding transcriptional regulator AlpA